MKIISIINLKYLKNIGLYIGMVMMLVLSGCASVAEDENLTEIPIEEATEKVVGKPIEDVVEEQRIQDEKNFITEEKSFIVDEGMTLEERFLLPEGYARTEEAEGSFAEFMRNYPVKEAGSPVLLYDGSKKGNQSVHEAVLDMHIEPRDLQQCADSVMRIFAEYLYEKGEYGKISFQLVNGFTFDFATWSSGNRLLVNGNETSWSAGSANDTSKESLERYLQSLFAYASTLSMDRESTKIAEEEIQIGDIFIKGGSPGHVVMVADICENTQGEKAFLLAQGYMPAQEFHILKNPQDEENPWYFLRELTYPFITPEYTFPEGSLRNLPYLD